MRMGDTGGYRAGWHVFVSFPGEDLVRPKAPQGSRTETQQEYKTRAHQAHIKDRIDRALGNNIITWLNLFAATRQSLS